jgi:hypothetical protein
VKSAERGEPCPSAVETAVDRLGIDEERPGDLFRRQPAQQAKNQGDVRFLRQVFVADREHHRELVGIVFSRQRRLDDASDRPLGFECWRKRRHSFVATDGVDRATPRHLENPGLGIPRRSESPRLHRRDQRVLDNIFGQREIRQTE